jgi:hypothetical protein
MGRFDLHQGALPEELLHGGQLSLIHLGLNERKRRSIKPDHQNSRFLLKPHAFLLNDDLKAVCLAHFPVL